VIALVAGAAIGLGGGIWGWSGRTRPGVATEWRVEALGARVTAGRSAAASSEGEAWSGGGRGHMASRSGCGERRWGPRGLAARPSRDGYELAAGAAGAGGSTDGGRGRAGRGVGHGGSRGRRGDRGYRRRTTAGGEGGGRAGEGLGRADPSEGGRERPLPGRAPGGMGPASALVRQGGQVEGQPRGGGPDGSWMGGLEEPGGAGGSWSPRGHWRRGRCGRGLRGQVGGGRRGGRRVRLGGRAS
jgi:hypothetical protein